MGAFQDLIFSTTGGGNLTVYLPLEELGTETPVNIGNAGTAATITHTNTIGQQNSIVYGENFSMEYPSVASTNGALGDEEPLALIRLWCHFDVGEVNADIISFGDSADPTYDIRLYIENSVIKVDALAATYTSSLTMIPDAKHYLNIFFESSGLIPWVNENSAGVLVTDAIFNNYVYDWFKLGSGATFDVLVDESGDTLQDQSGNNLIEV